MHPHQKNKKAGRLTRLIQPGWDKRRRLFPAPTSPGQYFHRCLGGLGLVLFLVQLLTGLLLLGFYLPWVEEAQASIMNLETGGLGWMLRRVHAAGAGLMVLLILLHMLKVLWTRAYLPPRQWNWVSGVGLLFMTLITALSGQVLVWDQTGQNLVLALSSLLDIIPVLGPWLGELVKGGPAPAQAALGRMFALHLLMPLIMLLLLRAHFIMVRRTGVARGL